MTTTTLSPVDLQSAIITDLKADATLVSQVSDEIREESWMGDEFQYPAVRVDVTDFPVRRTTGQCHGRWFDFSASLFVFTEGKSSLECQQIMGTLGRHYQNDILSSSEFRSQHLNIDYIPPVGVSQNAWRGEVIVTGRIFEL